MSIMTLTSNVAAEGLRHHSLTGPPERIHHDRIAKSVPATLRVIRLSMD